MRWTHALAVIAAVGALLVAPTSAGATVPSGPAPSQWNTDVLALINSERHDHGLAALTANANLAKAAITHSANMARYDKLTSRTPNEGPIGAQIKLSGYAPASYYVTNYGEFAGASHLTEAGALAVQAYLYSGAAANTKAAILNKHMKNAGVGIYLDRVHNVLWLTEFFAAH